jgi:hypothetical protein
MNHNTTFQDCILNSLVPNDVEVVGNTAMAKDH